MLVLLTLVVMALLGIHLLASFSSSDPFVEEVEVYKAIIDQRVDTDLSNLIFMKESIWGSSPDEYVDKFQYENRDLSELKRSFHLVNKQSSSLPLPNLDNLAVLTTAEYVRIFPGQRLSLAWKKFFLKYAPAKALVRMSRVGFDEDAKSALVYFTHGCGTHCGHGEMILLEKTLFGWKVIWIENLWVS